MFCTIIIHSSPLSESKKYLLRAVRNLYVLIYHHFLREKELKKKTTAVGTVCTGIPSH